MEQVKCIPGGEDYTQEKMYAYFAGKRTSQGMTKKSIPPSDQPPAAHHPQKHAIQSMRPPSPQRKPSLNTAQICKPCRNADGPSALNVLRFVVYPSLITDPSILPKLDILLDDTPSPPLDVAKIWASRLGSDVQLNDIMTYADLRLARMRRGDVSIYTPSRYYVHQCIGLVLLLAAYHALATPYAGLVYITRTPFYADVAGRRD